MTIKREIRPYYRWWWHKYRTSLRVLEMGLAAQGAYRNLLDAQWERGGDPLPTNRAVLWKLALAESREAYEAVAAQVEAMFEKTQDGQFLTNDTLTREWEQSTEFLEDIRKKRSLAGKIGNLKRWGTSQAGRKPIANAISEDRNSSLISTSSTKEDSAGPQEAEGDEPFNASEVAIALCTDSGISGVRRILAFQGAIEHKAKSMLNTSTPQVGQWLMDAWQHNKKANGKFAGKFEDFFSEAKYETASAESATVPAGYISPSQKIKQATEEEKAAKAVKAAAAAVVVTVQ